MRLEADTYVVDADETKHRKVVVRGDDVVYGTYDLDGRFEPEATLSHGDHVVLGHARAFRATGNSDLAISETDEDPQVVAPDDPQPDEELAGDALQERARDLDIQGRSQMNADELRKAVADAEAERQNDQRRRAEKP